MTLRPFFSYYGSKWRMAPKYPAPRHARLVESFAGAAGYSLRYPEHKVELYDANPVICGLWDYLIHASERDILDLPVNIDSVEDAQVCQEAKWLIGFWFNVCASSPCKTRTKWASASGAGWGEKIRARVASQLSAIRHWKVEQCSYTDIETDEDGSWFVDPPYVVSGRYYIFNGSQIDYEHLGQWCRQLPGQVIVCEQEGAAWLPFDPLGTFPGQRKPSIEVIWTNDIPSSMVM